MKRLIFILLLNTSVVYAFPAFTIKDMQVTGLQRISIGTIFNYFPLTVGDTVDDASLANAIKSLYSKGMFKNITVECDNNTLILRILERPIISSLEFSGNKDIQTKILVDAYKRLDLSPSRVLNKPKLEKAREELRQQYIAKGRYGTKVIVHQIPLERNRIALKIEVQEGTQALVQQIKFIGNKQISDDTLLSKLVMQPASWWEIFTTSNRFSQNILSRDANTIRQFYINQGFVNFKLLSYNVVLTNNKKNIIISYQMDEGERFSINHTQVSGIESQEIQKAANKVIHDNIQKIYSKKHLIGIKKQLENKLGDFGYALSKVKLDIDTLDDDHLVDIDYDVDLGQITYIREIKINGNNSTRDDVIRRELREHEGARFSASEIKISTSRLRRLGYFQTVNVQIKPVENSDDQVDIIYTVVETNTGSAKIGMTYEDTNGLGIDLGLSHTNFLGTGKKFNLSFVTNKVNKVNNLSITNPYFSKYGISLKYGIFNNEKDTSKITISSYSKNSTGLHGSFGIPINEYDKIFIGGTVSRSDFTCGSSFSDCLDYSKQYGEQTGNNKYKFNLYDIYLSWSRDSRNNGIFPTSGISQRLSFTYSAGDADYQKAIYVYKYFIPIFEKSTVKLTTDMAYGTGNSNDDKLPFFTRYFAGGIGSVRGFKSNSLTATEDGKNIGGSFRTIFHIDVITPFIFAPDSPSIRMSTFIDSGYAFQTQSDFDFAKLNSSYGISILWRSPIIPLIFSYALPLKSDSSSNEQYFQFQIGYSF